MRGVAVTAAIGAFALVAVAATLAGAETTSKTLRARGAFVAYEAEAKVVSIRERTVVRSYAVREEGTDATVVTIEGRSARLTDLEAGSPLLVSWQRDPSDSAGRVALALEVPKIPKSFREDLR